MNAYLSREEREQFIRLICLRVVIDTAIETYAGLKNIDKPFLSELRHARTRLDKALNIRLDALDPEANENLYKAASKLKLMFLATPEAKKATEEMRKLKSILPMSLDDFEDWYSFVIEGSCKTCTRENYAECPARRVLAKYDVFPADPSARGKCQYSYVGTDMEDKSIPETENDMVPVLRYNLAVSQRDSLETKINEQYLPEIKGLRERLDALKVRAELDPETERSAESAGMLPVTLVLSSGAKVELDLPERMAQSLLNDMRRPGIANRGLCACQIDGEMIAVDMAEVVMLKMPGLVDEHQKQKDYFSARPAFDDSGARQRYRVECKCGAEYFCSMNVGRERARCRECKTTVFADIQATPATDPIDGVQATLLTNRYWVGRNVPAGEPATLSSRNEYVDPCNPFKE